MVRQALVLGLRCTSSSMRNKWADLLAKLLRRILMSVHAVLVKQRAAQSRKARGKRVEADAQSEEDMAGELINVLRTSGRRGEAVAPECHVFKCVCAVRAVHTGQQAGARALNVWLIPDC